MSEFKHIRNIYFACREVGTTLEYRIIANIEEVNKLNDVYKLELEGFKVVKVLANE